MNLEEKITTILDTWCGTGMIQDAFGDPDEIIEDLRVLIRKHFHEQNKENVNTKTFFQLLYEQILTPNPNFIGSQEDRELEYDLELYHLEAKNWPEDEDEEPLDLENWE